MVKLSDLEVVIMCRNGQMIGIGNVGGSLIIKDILRVDKPYNLEAKGDVICLYDEQTFRVNFLFGKHIIHLDPYEVQGGIKNVVIVEDISNSKSLRMYILTRDNRITCYRIRPIISLQDLKHICLNQIDETKFPFEIESIGRGGNNEIYIIFRIENHKYITQWGGRSMPKPLNERSRVRKFVTIGNKIVYLTEDGKLVIDKVVIDYVKDFDARPDGILYYLTYDGCVIKTYAGNPEHTTEIYIYI